MSYIEEWVRQGAPLDQVRVSSRPRRTTMAPGLRVWRVALAGCWLALAGLLACGSSAFAVTQQGHAFSGALTVPVEDATLNEPNGVAVDEATGDAYIADQGNHRIVRLGANGEFLSAWGYGVRTGTNEFQVCESNCKAGIAGKNEYQLRWQVQSIAVDNSTATGDPSAGDVYVATRYVTQEDEEDEEGRELIYKFGPNGEKLERIDAVSYEEEGENESIDLEASETYGLTVASNGTVWLYYEERLYPLSDKGLSGRAGQPLGANVAVGAAPGVAVSASGTFYVGNEGYSGSEHPPDVIAKEAFEEESVTELEPVIGALDPENTTGVAVDESSSEADSSRGDVYLDQGGAITAFSSAGTQIQRFGDAGEDPGALQGGVGLADDARSDTVYAADATGDRVNVYAPRVDAAPAVDETEVREVGAEAARLRAQIDTNGSAASYYFEYGTAPCASEPPACTHVQGSPASLVAAFGDQRAEASLQLRAGTTYHYRVIVADAHGTAASGEGSFSTLPEHAGAGVADGRVWEMVSPPDKNGAQVELGSTFSLSSGGRIAEAAENGQAVTYTTNGPVGEAQGNRSFEPTQMLSVRGPEGWTETQDIVTPSEHAEGLVFQQGSEYRSFSSNLALALVQPFNEASRTRLAEPPLSPPTSEAERGRQEKTLYVRSDQAITPKEGPEAQLYAEAKANGEKMGMENEGYVPLVTEADVLPGAEFGSEEPAAQPLQFEGATPDLGHVVIKSEVKGQGCEPSSELGCAPGLYEWYAERQGREKLRLINRLAGGVTEETKTSLGGGAERITRHAISNNGSRVFWSVGNPQHLYLSNTADESEQPLELNETQGGSGLGEAHPIFQTASPDGSRVFFTDEERLTEGSGAADGKPDLYECEIAETPGHLKCALGDLSPCRAEVNPESHKQQCVESADVQGLVLGAGEEDCDVGQSGCNVYFVANGVLTEAKNAQGEKATPGDCDATYTRYAQAACNLYIERYEDGTWESPTFIARISNDDSPDDLSKFEGINAVMTSARVSPNGRYVAFMSDRELTGYDNRDAITGEPDEEVFLYEASSEAGKPGKLVCTSCDPSGARPNGVLDIPHQESEAGTGLLVDRNGAWAGHRLAGSLPDWMMNTELLTNNQPRYLSNSGRLYFDSPSDLVPQATNGKEDVYEYEPAGVPQGAHECTDASAEYSARAEGCLGLISSGTASGEAAFVDASEAGGEGPGGEELQEGGGDVFFATAAKLVPQDTDEAFDVYDAHECTGAEPCFTPPEEKAPSSCENGEACQPFSYSSPPSTAPATGSPSGLGNMPPKQGVSASTTVKPKRPTRAQQLAKALASCRSKYKHSRKKRAACERTARKRYGPVKKKAKKGAKKASKSDARGRREPGGTR